VQGGSKVIFLSVTIQMKATNQYFPVVLFSVLYKVFLTLESVGEFIKCDNSAQCLNFCRTVP